MYDYSKLLGRIIEKFGTQSKFAEAMKISERTISLKLTGKVDWKQREIESARSLLELAESDIPAYFFTLKVQRD